MIVVKNRDRLCATQSHSGLAQVECVLQNDRSTIRGLGFWEEKEQFKTRRLQENTFLPRCIRLSEQKKFGR